MGRSQAMTINNGPLPSSPPLKEVQDVLFVNLSHPDPTLSGILGTMMIYICLA